MTEITIFLITTDIAIALAVWRISVLLIDDNWPFNVMGRFRTWIGVYDLEQSNWVTELFSCMYCMSLWVTLAVMAALYLSGTELPFPGVRVFAYSGAACIIDYKMVGRERSAR